MLELPLVSYAQVADKFEQAELNKAIWSGDIDDFIVENGVLRLSAPSDKGQSILVLDISQVTDITQWNIDVRMDFNPSSQNRLNVYLFADEASPKDADGLLMGIGETGSDDAITIYQKVDGDIFPVAVGEEGSVASSPSFSIEVSKNGNEHTASVINNQKGNETIRFQLDGEEDKKYFIIECIYTSTRSDRFFFDNVYLGPKIDDVTPPSLVSSIIGEKAISLVFDERVDDNSVSESNFEFMPEFILTEVIVNKDKVELSGDSPFERGVEYQLSLTGIKDISGNEMDTIITFLKTEGLKEGDIKINEILFNPRGSGSDYVEIINSTEQILSLDGLSISNESNGRSVIIAKPNAIQPGEIIVFTEDKANIITAYPTHMSSQIYEQDLPSFSNDKGNVTLELINNGQRKEIDSYTYSEKDHFLLLDDEDGVSLERINLNVETQEKSNWTSASSTAGYGTPGVTNSVNPHTVVPTKDFFKVVNKVFSPNGDNIDDEAVLEYSLPSSFVANVTVYDLNGKVVKRLLQNKTTGTQGRIIWDGYGENTTVSPQGIYVLVIEVFNLDGRVIRHKEELVIGGLTK